MVEWVERGSVALQLPFSKLAVKSSCSPQTEPRSEEWRNGAFNPILSLRGNNNAHFQKPRVLCVPFTEPLKAIKVI